MSVRMTCLGTALVTAMAVAAVPAAADRGAPYRGDGHGSLTRHHGPYVTGFIGGALGGEYEDGIFELDLDSGFLVGGTLGFDNLFAGSGGDVRVEAEISHRSQDFENIGGEVDVTTLLGNAWYDFDLNGPMVPYIGGGIGVGFLDDTGVDGTGFAWQLGGGLNYHLTPEAFLGFNYRYLFTDAELDLPADPDGEYGAHQLSASFGYKF